METITKSKHPTEELLEQYAAGKLPSETVAEVSTHLFECDSCFDLYENEVNLRISFRQAAAVVPAIEPAPAQSFWSRLFVMPSPALMAGAAAAVLLLFAVVPRGTNNGATPVVAELSAMRSAGSTITLEAGHPLQLKMKTPGVVSGTDLRVQVVNETGSEVWTSETTVRSDAAEVKVDRKLTAGQYWIRLFGRGDTEPLREYGLTLK